MSRKKRKPLEFIKFFWRDFNGDTAHLTRAQQGGYLQIICAYYDNHGALHENAIMKASGASIEEWKTERELIARFFTIDAIGMWRHKRIEKELKEVRDTSKRRSASGKKGGQAKAKLASARQVLSKSLATKDVSNELSTKPVPIARQRLSKTENELIDARAAVWALEQEAQQAQREIDEIDAGGKS